MSGRYRSVRLHYWSRELQALGHSVRPPTGITKGSVISLSRVTEVKQT
jgi:hypothetical protein